MKTTKTIIIVVLAAIMFLFAACQPAATPAPAQPPKAEPTQPPAPAEPTKPPAPAEPKGTLALVLTGPSQDNSWNEASLNAIQELEKKGYKVAFSENVASGDEQRVMREYVAQGFKMIVAHSFGFGDGTFVVAEEHPEVNFAWAGGMQKTAKNVADYDQPFYQAMYPIGIIIAHVSKTGKIGALYGFDIPVCHSMGEAVLAGAKTVNPNAELLVSSVGEWEDVAKAKAAGLALADAGADYFISCGEGPTLGSIKAAEERGLFANGYVGDMTENGPNVVLTNVIWNMEPLFQKMLDDTQAGTFDNPWYVFGVKEGAMTFSINPGLKDKIPPEALAAAEKALADIKAGTIVVPFIPE